MGAKVIEKHFTISKKLYGPDARYSLEPEEFKKLVEDINYVKKALSNNVDKDNLDEYIDMNNIGTDKQSADIFTKHFTGKDKWEIACRNISHYLNSPLILVLLSLSTFIIYYNRPKYNLESNNGIAQNPTFLFM